MQRQHSNCCIVLYLLSIEIFARIIAVELKLINVLSIKVFDI